MLALQTPQCVESLTLEHQNCCLCRVDNAEPVAFGEDFEYHSSPDTFSAVRCRHCGLIYLNPRPSTANLNQIYPARYHAFQFDEKQFGLAYRVRRRLEARRLLQCCESLPEDARILDVGCGDGFHLGILKEFGRPRWKLTGIDVSRIAVEIAVQSGLDVREGTVQSSGLPPGSMDLVLLIATIEHVADPVGILSSIRTLLKPGGRVLIVTDNSETIDSSIFSARHWGGYHFPRHWNLFSKPTIAKLSLHAGLRLESLETIVSPVNWVYSIRNFLQDRGTPAWVYEQFSLKSPVSLAVFTVVDMICCLFDSGALLRAVLRRQV